MPKLILRCNYLNNSPPTHLANYINYIGTRDGVEKVSITTTLLPSTAKQKELVTNIGDGAFHDCISLKSVTYKGQIYKQISVDSSIW